MLVHYRVPRMKQLGVLLLSPGGDANPSQGTQHEETRSITDYSPLDGMLVHHKVPQHEENKSITTTPPWMRC